MGQKRSALECVQSPLSFMSYPAPFSFAREPLPDHEQKQAALSYLNEAWAEARHDGVDGDCLAQASLFAALAARAQWRIFAGVGEAVSQSCLPSLPRNEGLASFQHTHHPHPRMSALRSPRERALARVSKDGHGRWPQAVIASQRVARMRAR
jgi:hypothetical protein